MKQLSAVLCWGLLVLVHSSRAQDNLVHPPAYKTSGYGSMPSFIKKGHGPQALILIPGLGFDASVFDDLMTSYASEFTMYAITVPGYGDTPAPPMPAAGASYGGQYWGKGVERGIIALMDKEKLVKPIIAGHFVQGVQLALRLAIDHPDRVGGVILMGGPARFIAILQGQPREFPLKNAIDYVDGYTAPQWFRTISKKNFDEGNYLPEIYSLDTTEGGRLWRKSAAVALPVMVRYLCEFFASDITLETESVRCPVLVLRPLFDSTVLNRPVNNYVRPQFIDSWNRVAAGNTHVLIRDIPGAAAFVWKDNPSAVREAIKAFITK